MFTQAPCEHDSVKCFKKKGIEHTQWMGLCWTQRYLQRLILQRLIRDRGTFKNSMWGDLATRVPRLGISSIIANISRGDCGTLGVLPHLRRMTDLRLRRLQAPNGETPESMEGRSVGWLVKFIEWLNLAYTWSGLFYAL